MDDFLRIWPLIQTTLGFFVALIAYLAKQAVSRAEVSTREIRVSIDAIRTEVHNFATQVAVTNERIEAHQEADEKRFIQIEHRLDRLQADLARHIAVFEQYVFKKFYGAKDGD